MSVIALALAGVGLAVVIAWPTEGPGMLVRERVLRPLLARLRMARPLDCVLCGSVWGALAVAAAAAASGHGTWIDVPLAALAAPAMVYLAREVRR